ncbi:MAG: DNA mismatch repair endonuclease MutL [Candidatus Aminicenantes bacterium]|nr:DNA mismatch repair endonuclease MutL [Candidatus Aminicenantes bacterium]
MTRIRVLPPEVAGKIAAGEVVERPASVVKELVENALDAGAGDIRVELQDGGKRLVRVLDNGSGMGQEDAVLCFRRHATSKIASEEDLGRIQSLGFRGEALASIAAVSRLTLKTSDGATERGTQVVREGEKLVSVSDAAFPRGTSVEVRDLFFNLPARRKFLRSDRSELTLIVKYLTTAALAYPAVRFVLQHGGREVLNAPPVAGLRERVFQLYSKSVLDGLLELDYAEGEGRVSGLASRPLAGRPDRTHQLLFVNLRPVRDRILQAALNQAYLGRLEKGRSPEAFLFLAVPFAEVDVNVHPAKAEVRFADAQAVFRMVLRAVEVAMVREMGVKTVYPSATAPAAGPRVEEEQKSLGLASGDRVEAVETGRRVELLLPGVKEPGPTAGPQPLGQYLNMYIVAAAAEGLLVIDQHNAHERVLYEKYLEIDRARTWPRKTLLVPVVIDLSPAQTASFEENAGLLDELGFGAELMGGRSLAIKEYPDLFRTAEARDVFLALLEEAGEDRPADRRAKFLATLACKTAIKAGQPLTGEKMAYLVEELFRTSQPALCPHGRPVVVRLERAQIEKGLRRHETP